MKNNKLLSVLVLALIISNVFLFSIVLKKDEPKTDKQPDNGTQNLVSEFDTNITQLVEKTQNKVVSVITKNRGDKIGSGSGVVYKNENGKVKIVTNHHVIDGGSEFVVRMASGEEIEAKLVGSDQYTDLALLEFEAEIDVEAFTLGDSGLSKVGEFVIAIGSPLGVEFENSVTFGIISGKNRVVPVDLNNDGVSDWDMVVLQTDAAINPGNSGGALVNMAGELIGINSLKFSSSNVEGMGFSIPVSEMIPIIKQLDETGEVNYPVIGVSATSVNELNSFQRTRQNIPENIEDGVLIAEVIKGGAADKAGIKAGDIMISFDNEKITSFKDFRRYLYQHEVGDTVEIEVIRGGKTAKVEVTLE